MENEPEYPEDGDYLIQWAFRLHGRSGATINGLAPLSYTAIESWSNLNGILGLLPEEVDALIYLDDILLGHESLEAEEAVVVEREHLPWPKKK